MTIKKANKFEPFVDQAFGEDGLLAQNLPGYVERKGQVEIAQKIEQHVLGGNGILFAEGPTGVGKSIAALVPAFDSLRTNPEGFVLVVTSSILLQEQYLHKDIPFLEGLFDFKVNPVLLKGKRNYLCNYKATDTKMAGVTTNTNTALQHSKVRAWASETRTGDINELDFVPQYEVWKEYSIVEDGECTGKQCPAFKQCFYYANRAKSTKARIIVCNYHYFLLASMSDGMLPGTPQMIIFDEAHEVANITRDFQENILTPNSFSGPATMLMNAAKNADSENGGSMEHFVKGLGFGELQDRLTDEASILHGIFRNEKSPYQEYVTLDFDNIEIYEQSLRRIGRLLQARYLEMKAIRGSLDDYVDSYGIENWSDAEKKWYNIVRQMTEILEKKTTLILHAIKSPQDAAYLTWLQPVRDKTKALLAIHRKPFSAKLLAENVLFNSPAVFISATLSIEGSFTYYRKELGAPKDRTDEIVAESPFKLDENLLWYLPENCPEGAGNNGHIDFVLNEMQSIAERLNGRTMMLFTSRSNMLQAVGQMEKAFEHTNVRVLNQHDHPKDRILTAMRSDPHVIVIGTKSFFTGVDIPGSNLSAVLIDKMPFPLTGDPVNNYLMSQERGFHRFTLPETIITSKQAVGRLNRRVSDVGIVAIFDGRLRTKQYKKKFFRSFGFKIQAASTKEEIEKFVKEKIQL